MLEEIRRKQDDAEGRRLRSEVAFPSKNAVRKAPETEESGFDFRNAFVHDADRILHSRAFARYMDKTQVFCQIKNDHITRRALHVQMVSRIARTVGRCLGLNEDLIEAIALGHDIGHTPFGHCGEHALSGILEKRNKGCFVHNAQSVRVLQILEKKNGRNLNLTLPVLDGILGHNGEIESQIYRHDPQNLSWERLEENLKRCFLEKGYDRKVFPSTLEGCCVRVADMIAYVGKDFEDAVTLNIIKTEELPDGAAKVFLPDNRNIINTLCNDLITNSYGKNYLMFSSRIFNAFQILKNFNSEKIYRCPMLQYQDLMFSRSIGCLFDLYLDDLHRGNRDSGIFKHHVNRLGDAYLENEVPERIVSDYIASMTDQYFLKQFERQFMPLSYDYDEVEFFSKVVEKAPDIGTMW